MTDSKAPPPAYQSPEPLQTSSHGVTLSLQRVGPLHPGSELRLILSVPPDVLSSAVGDAECTLQGTSTYELMGKKRYQTGMMLNASLGPAGGAMVTSREHHTFASVSSPIPLHHGGSSSSKYKGDAPEPDGLAHTLRIPAERTCTCAGPRGEGVLPSFGAAGDHADESSVEWRLEVVIKRKGLLKRDIKLSLALPVSLPQSPAPLYPLTATSSIAYAYDTSSPSSSVPSLTSTLSLSPPPAPGQIPFRLVLAAPPHLLPASSDLPPTESGFDIAVALSRGAWTKGIQQASFDDAGGFDWAARRTGTTSLATMTRGGPNAARSGRIRLVSPTNGEKGGAGAAEMIFEGVYEHPAEYQTVRGCGLAVNWALHAHVTWKRLSGTLSVEIPLILPLAAA